MPTARDVIVASLLCLFSSTSVRADDRFTVCSVTINSDDEIRLLERSLPASQFRFVELTDQAPMPSARGESSWLEGACRRGVRCDVLVVSGHFGNTWAGNYGTTFAGRSGATLSLADLERRRCENSCTGVLSDPLEVFLLGCKTLSSTSDGPMMAASDVAVLGAHHVPPASAVRLVDEARNGGDGTSSRGRMQFVFAGVPRIYGFTDVAPSGKRVAPLLEKYLAGVGDYAEHLRALRTSRSGGGVPNEALARALEPTCFEQCGGLDPSAAAFEREQRACRLEDDRSPVLERLEQVEKLLDEPDFLTYLPAIDAFLRAHPPAALDDSAMASLERIRGHDRARNAAIMLLGELESPVLLLEILRVSRSVNWIQETEALPVQRRIVSQLLRLPIYGEDRDLICAMGADVLRKIQIRAEDVSPEIYANEFGIQALGCLTPTDERIHAHLARSLSDPREWIARLAAIALRAMSPVEVDVQMALAEQLGRADAGPRLSAAAALRALRPSDPRVLTLIRAKDPTFRTDGL